MRIPLSLWMNVPGRSNCRRTLYRLLKQKGKSKCNDINQRGANQIARLVQRKLIVGSVRGEDETRLQRSHYQKVVES